MNFLSRNDDIQQCKILYRHNSVYQINLDATELRYRKADNTLILIIYEGFPVITTYSNVLNNMLLE